MTNNEFIGKKQKSKISFKDLNENQNTKLKFIIYDFKENEIKNYYTKIKLDFINKTFTNFNIIKKELIYFIIEFNSDKEQNILNNEINYFYDEKFILSDDKNNTKCFNLTIYLKELNTIYISLNKFKNSVSYELLYESVNNTLLLPKYIILNNYIFDNFDTFGDGFNKRLNIMNINNNDLSKNVTDEPLNNSYKISYRIITENKINKIIQFYDEEKLIEKKSIGDEKIKYINEFKKFDYDFKILINNDKITKENYQNVKNTYLNIVNGFNKIIKDFSFFDDDLKNYINIDANYVELYKYYSYCRLLGGFNLKKEDFEKNNSKLYDNYVYIIKFFIKYKNFIELIVNISLEEKEKFILIRGYFKYMILQYNKIIIMMLKYV